MCHVLLALALVGALAGCAPRSGWARVERVCSAQDPPRVCLDAVPDAPVRLRVGGSELVPGECAMPAHNRGGSVRVEVIDGRGAGRVSFFASTRRGSQTTVRVTPDAAQRPEVLRTRCD